MKYNRRDIIDPAMQIVCQTDKALCEAIKASDMDVKVYDTEPNPDILSIIMGQQAMAETSVHSNLVSLFVDVNQQQADEYKLTLSDIVASSLVHEYMHTVAGGEHGEYDAYSEEIRFNTIRGLCAYVEDRRETRNVVTQR